MSRFFEIFGIFSLSICLMYACTKTTNGNDGKENFVYKNVQDNSIAAKAFGKDVKKTELFADIQDEIYSKEKEIFELKKKKLKAYLIETLINEDPRKKDLSNDEFLEKYISKAAEVTPKDIQEFADKQGIPKAQINDELKNRIKAFLALQGKKDSVEKWLNQKMKDSPVEVYFEMPKRPTYEIAVTDNDPSMGPKDAKVTIVEYSDFQCPFCAKGAERVTELKKKYGNKVRFVFKHYPLPFHHHAKDAAAASMCVYEQDKKAFWKAHDFMFANQGELALDALKKKLPKETGVDTKKLSECIDQKKFASKVEQDIESGKKVHVKATPTFFINGELVNGAVPVEEFSQVIDKYL